MISGTRRLFAKRLAGALLERGEPLLSRASDLLAAGFIVRRGEHTVREIDGCAFTHGDVRAFGQNQPFRVASVSKMITALGFMRMVSSGAVDLDSDIARYLGESLRHPAYPEIAITARMLLSHTSGLRNGADFPVPFNQPLLARLHDAARQRDYAGWFAPTQQPPGAWFSYSDTNYAIVAQIIERVSGRRFDHYMTETFFEPLDLDIGYNWSGVSQRKRRRAAAGVRWQDGAWSAQVDANPPPSPEIALYRGSGDPNSSLADYRLGENGFAFAPHGGLRLSLADMDRLAQFFFRGAPLAGENALAEMIQPSWAFDPAHPNGDTSRGWYQSFGLGVHIPVGRDQPGASPGDAYFGANSSAWRGHFGDAYGLITGLFWNTSSNATLVYVLNGVREFDRPPGARSALSASEEAIVDLALAAIA